MARLVKTETEMEGRYQEVWVLVDEEDDLETWRAGEDLALVGRPTTRHDGAARAAGRVRYTVDVRLAGMLHAAVLRSPVAHGRVRGLELDAARRAPGVRAVLGPESELSLHEPDARSRRGAAVRGPADRGRRRRDTGTGAGRAGGTRP